MSNLNNKRVLITGGLGTLGRAFAKHFKDAGSHVTLLDRPHLSAHLPVELSGMDYLGCDLNKLSTIETMVAQSTARAGFDILLNNAALIINKPYLEFSLEEYEDQIRVNSSAAFALSRICAQHMKQKKWGRIINLTSITLNGQWDGYVPYIASKGAILGLTKGLARELGTHGITVNAISPGAVLSEAENRVFAHKLKEYNDWVLDRQCIKQRIQAEDIARLALFLATDGAKMISGQNIAVDGGW